MTRNIVLAFLYCIFFLLPYTYTLSAVSSHCQRYRPGGCLRQLHKWCVFLPQRVKADQNPAGLAGRTNKNVHHCHCFTFLQQPGSTFCCLCENMQMLNWKIKFDCFHHNLFKVLNFRVWTAQLYVAPADLFLAHCDILSLCRRLWALWSTPAEPRTSWTNLRSTRNSPRGRSLR